MLDFSILSGIFQSIFISLGVGSSTLAICNFFAAIADGTIDETERNMMGIVYVVLRVAMAGILLTTILLQLPTMIINGLTSLNVIMLSQWIILLVLYGNAILMTKHIMPSTFGPGIQAGSWYALGILTALVLQGVTGFTLWQFLLGYLALVVLAVAGVNGMMAHLRQQKQSA